MLITLTENCKTKVNKKGNNQNTQKRMLDYKWTSNDHLSIDSFHLIWVGAEFTLSQEPNPHLAKGFQGKCTPNNTIPKRTFWSSAERSNLQFLFHLRLLIVHMIPFLSVQCQFCKKSTSTITNHTFAVLKGLKQSFHTCNPCKSFPMLAIYNNLGVKTLFIFIWIILLEWNFSYQYLKLNANNNLKYIKNNQMDGS